MTRTKSVTELFGLPTPPKTGRERLIATAVELFYQFGFGAVGIDQILSTAGVTKSTFYKHFESKDDLMVAAVRRREEWEAQAWGNAIKQRAGDDPKAQLLAMLDVMDLWFNHPDFFGCMFMNAAAEFPNPHDPVHEAAAAFQRRTREHRRNLATAAGADAQTASTFADCYTALIDGAFMLRLTHGRNDAARVVKPAVEQLISAYLPSAARRTGGKPRLSRIVKSLLIASIVAIACGSGCTSKLVEVVDIDGKPIAGAEIQAVSLSMNVGGTFTNEKGTAHLPTNVQGTKWVDVSKTGFNRVQVDMPQEWPLRVTLSPYSGTPLHNPVRLEDLEVKKIDDTR